ncbi:uncharacterized protein LOC108109756 [Drosophila eugracilis]|uniref:uncharacterized protein LOC108109756 n=1 Tax=Drosophila eugracilis TaxID=29029 RepID=UPI0007E5BEF9|nr:uncharacterized protein LOC108109756 [Drosophila eugracilis]
MENGSDQSYEDFFDNLHSDSGPRNLRQIFEDDDRPLEHESSSLRYQPGSSKKSQSSKKPVKSHSSTLSVADPFAPTWNTVVAKVVHCYLSTESMGRVGLALSVYGEKEDFKLIVYKSKTKVLTTLQLSPRGCRLIQRDSYLQFYDDDKRFWSLRFDKESDEDEFVAVLAKNQLQVERFVGHAPLLSSGRSLSPSSKEDTASPPQPQPRSRLGIPSLEKLDAEEPEKEQTIHNEDVIVTPLPLPIGSSYNQKKPNSKFLATSEKTSDNSLAVKTLDKYMDEQRASGMLMENKMDAILQALKLMGKPGVAVDAPNESVIEHVDEDEMLELEQKLLNFKRENRALMRNLKARDQALEDLRCSACALCEELMRRNDDLNEQNAHLLAIKDHSDLSSASSCHNCVQSSKQIAKMQQHILALQEALRIFQKSGDPKSGRL